MSDHMTEMYAGAMAAVPVTKADLKLMLVKSVILASLENLMKHDDCPVLRAACRARYLDLTDGKAPQ